MTLHSFLENIKILETETGSFSSRHLSFPSSTPDPAAPSSLLPGILVTSPRCSAFTFRPAVSQCGKRMARDLTDTGMLCVPSQGNIIGELCTHLRGMDKQVNGNSILPMTYHFTQECQRVSSHATILTDKRWTSRLYSDTVSHQEADSHLSDLMAIYL
ncbi:uncharacterized protein LOC143793142 isoform X1 [Ranitomeya variabilis]|uniref:uncharacterized protein LOC143793142 isoform X1 n=1 Tax=Ranitomeya variabilis TaxID=490064 RepID=UPI0040575DD9